MGHLRESDNRASLPASVTLTARESEVLNHLAEGHSNREIAELMVLSGKSVKLHVTNMVSKFQVRDRLQLVIAHLGMPEYDRFADLAAMLRRLRRLARHYGSDPVFATASATATGQA